MQEAIAKFLTDADGSIVYLVTRVCLMIPEEIVLYPQSDTQIESELCPFSKGKKPGVNDILLNLQVHYLDVPSSTLLVWLERRAWLHNVPPWTLRSKRDCLLSIWVPVLSYVVQQLGDLEIINSRSGLSICPIWN